VPWAIAHAAFKRQKRNPGVTEIVKIPNRGHSLTIDSGWREVAEKALAFIQRHAPADGRGPADRPEGDQDMSSRAVPPK
jgi:non-heme chloroperoxidase